MNPRIDTRWNEIDALLDAVLDRPVDLRETWLQAHCNDEELRDLVLSLLAADAVRAAEFEARASAAHEWLSAHAADLPEIPGYRVLELVGEGGMASVFLAERQLGETIQRVALKRLRLNVYDPAERRRFEHEHRVLARLEHPNISRLLDAGIAPDGVPWFAMEYVEGESLIAWCDSRKLHTDARLALFAHVCAAIQHAHQHLVVHRDLKPSNILVDHDGNVKLLDFGIARLLDPDTEHPDGTRTELRRLTPGYAAPEQYAGLTSTATDIYALGMILNELMSGQKPAARRARGSDPLRNLTITREAADARASTPRALERLLAGDLGTIARKATRSEPALRYASAQALADDVVALRSGRPVAARRGDWRYRAACFVRRNKTVAAASVVIAVTLLVTTAISLQQAREARAQAARAKEVQAFVSEMLMPLRSGVPAARMPRLDEALARGVQDLEHRRTRDPVVYSELLTMFANTYDRMGDTRTARELSDRAYAHAVQAFGRDDPRTARPLALRGRIYLRLQESRGARNDLESARRLMQRHHIEGVALAEVLDDLGGVEVSARRYVEAGALYTEAQRQRRLELGPGHPDLAIGYANFAMLEQLQDRPERALALFEQAYRHRVLHEGADTREVAILLGYIARIKGDLGRLQESVRDHQSALAALDRLGQDNPPERYVLAIDACVDWLQLDDTDHAMAQCEAAMAITAHHWGVDSRLHAVARRYRILVLIAQGRLAEARAEAASIRKVLREIPGEGAGDSAQLVAGFFSAGQEIEGDYPAMREDLGAFLRTRIAGEWSCLQTAVLARYALACTAAPGPDCPADIAAQAEREMDALKATGKPLRIGGQLTLARLDLMRGDLARAHARLDDIEAVAALPQMRLPAGHRWLAQAHLLRGDALDAQGDRAGARSEWEAAEVAFAARYAPDHPFRRHLADRLRTVALQEHRAGAE